MLKISAPEQREHAKKKQDLLGAGRKVGVHVARRRPAHVLLGWLKRTKSHHMSGEEEEKEDGISWSQ